MTIAELLEKLGYHIWHYCECNRPDEQWEQFKTGLDVLYGAGWRRFMVGVLGDDAGVNTIRTVREGWEDATVVAMLKPNQAHDPKMLTDLDDGEQMEGVGAACSRLRALGVSVGVDMEQVYRDCVYDGINGIIRPWFWNGVKDAAYSLGGGTISYFYPAISSAADRQQDSRDLTMAFSVTDAKFIDNVSVNGPGNLTNSHAQWAGDELKRLGIPACGMCYMQGDWWPATKAGFMDSLMAGIKRYRELVYNPGLKGWVDWAKVLAG